MAPDAYGAFAFGLALATVLAILAATGQPTAILRFWAEDSARDDHEGARAAVRAGGFITAAMGTLLGMALSVIALTGGFGAAGFGWTIAAAGLLIVPLALAEFNSSALRAQGSVWTALAPRDLMWRIALPGAVLLLAGLGIGLTGGSVLALGAGLLAIMLGLQYFMAARQGRVLTPDAAPVRNHWHRRGATSRWLLCGALLETLALNADTVIVGFLGTAENAGLYFNAFRTAGLMTLASFAVTLVVAPLIAEHYHAGRLRIAQAVATTGVWVGFLAALGAYGLFWLLGEEILGLFGENYREGYFLLMLVATGLAVDAAVGPARTIMMMTGHERVYVGTIAAVILLAILCQIIVFPIWGLVGVATTTMGARIVGQLALAYWCRSRTGIDPTIFGVTRVLADRKAKPDRPETIS